MNLDKRLLEILLLLTPMEQRELYVLLHQMYYRRMENKATDDATKLIRKMMKA